MCVTVRVCVHACVRACVCVDVYMTCICIAHHCASSTSHPFLFRSFPALRPPFPPCSAPAYGEAGLELAPTRRLPSQGVPLPRVGAVDWSSGEVTEEQKRTLEAAMYRLREQVAQRRVLAKPCFQDFDRFEWVGVYISVHLCIHVYVCYCAYMHTYVYALSGGSPCP